MEPFFKIITAKTAQIFNRIKSDQRTKTPVYLILVCGTNQRGFGMDSQRMATRLGYLFKHSIGPPNKAWWNMFFFISKAVCCCCCLPSNRSKQDKVEKAKFLVSHSCPSLSTKWSDYFPSLFLCVCVNNEGDRQQLVSNHVCALTCKATSRTWTQKPPKIHKTEMS